MRKVVAAVLACLLLFAMLPVRAGEMAASAPVYGCAYDLQTGRVARFLLIAPDTQAPDAQAVVDALISYKKWTTIASVETEGAQARVEFSGAGWGSDSERDALDAVACTLLMYDASLEEVYIALDGVARPTGGAPYLTRARFAYNPNRDASGGYVDPDKFALDATGGDADGIANGGAVGAMPHVATGSTPPQGEAAANALAYGAADWIDRIARAAGGEGGDFQGTPPADLAWKLIDAQLREDLAQSGVDAGAPFFALPAAATAAYDAQFAYGRVPSSTGSAEAPSREGDLYSLPAADADLPIDAVINGASVNAEGDLEVDVSMLRDQGEGATFMRNLTLVFVPDSGSAKYCMKLGALRSLPRAAAFEAAEVVRASDGSALAGQSVEALSDGDTLTGWLAGAQGGEGALKLSGEARALRGLMLTPLSGPGDIREVRVTLSDGNVYEQAFDGGVGGVLAMPFEGVRTVEWLRIELVAEDGAVQVGLSEVDPF